LLSSSTKLNIHCGVGFQPAHQLSRDGYPTFDAVDLLSSLYVFLFELFCMGFHNPFVKEHLALRRSMKTLNINPAKQRKGNRPVAVSIAAHAKTPWYRINKLMSLAMMVAVFISSRCTLTKLLSMTALILGALIMIVQHPGLLGVAILGVAAAIAWPQYQRLPRYWRWGARFLVAGGVACVAAIWLSSYEPAQAQFFRGAEIFFSSTFCGTVPATSSTTTFNSATAQAAGTCAAGSVGNAITIVFSALRALYILYLAVSLINVINAVRQDEDWQTVARTPVLIVVVITLADILTGLIIGQTTTTGGGAP
jgi:hypothetical protein